MHMDRYIYIYIPHGRSAGEAIVEEVPAEMVGGGRSESEGRE